MTEAPEGTDVADGDALGGFRVVAGSPTEEELAAATAVIVALASATSPEPVTPRGPDAWQRSQRSVRGPLVPGPGRWRGFSG